MSFEAWWTILVVGLLLIALVREVAGADVLFFGALGLLMLSGVITAEEALSGFSNAGVATIGVLFVISAAIKNTGAINRFVYDFLGTRGHRNLSRAMLKMMIPISLFSVFLNNTAIVTLFVPLVKKWAEKIKMPASKFLIPLSYATVLGGLCSLIGTSTNLVVHGLILQKGLPGFTFFELAKIGVPCTLVGWIYLAFVGSKLLPERKSMSTTVFENSREYLVEMKVTKNCELVGKTVKEAGLRNLKGLFLLDIEREKSSLGPVSSVVTILEGDHLVFAGLTSAVMELQEIPGLVPAAHELFDKDFHSQRTHLVEVVISPQAPIVGKTIKESDFRSRYGSGVIAVHRNGERVRSKIGEIKIKAGDTFLLFSHDNFVTRWQDSPDFYLISAIRDRAPDVAHKAFLVLGIVLAMILASVFAPYLPKIGGKPITVFHAVMGAALLLFGTRSILGREVRESIQWKILIVIACSFGISQAIIASGLAGNIANVLIQLSAGWGPIGALIGIYLITNLMTEVITNNAAAALVFPIAYATALQLGVNPMPFFVAITIAASAGFSTPIGYQTHMIVQGAGGYHFRDYLKVGIPLNLICFVLSILIIPIFWHF